MIEIAAVARKALTAPAGPIATAKPQLRPPATVAVAMAAVVVARVAAATEQHRLGGAEQLPLFFFDQALAFAGRRLAMTVEATMVGTCATGGAHALTKCLSRPVYANGGVARRDIGAAG